MMQGITTKLFINNLIQPVNITIKKQQDNSFLVKGLEGAETWAIQVGYQQYEGLNTLKEHLKNLGVNFEEKYSGVYFSVPEGWVLKPESKHSDIHFVTFFDEKGKQRMDITYKSALYERYTRFKIYD